MSAPRRVKEKEELVQLWNEIHYHKDMEKHHTDSLTSVQKFRCRKRNPPPVSLCPEGTTNRNYPEKVRQTLHRFAANVTVNPNMDQRDTLAQDTNLKPIQVYNWFANYRRRRRAQLKWLEKLISSTDEEPSTRQAKHQPDSRSCIPQAADAFHAGIDSEHKEINTLMPCGPGWKQSAVGLDYSADGTFSTLLESSSPQAVLGKSQCPPVPTSYLEEIEGFGHSQVLENPLIDPMTDCGENAYSWNSQPVVECNSHSETLYGGLQSFADCLFWPERGSEITQCS